ncbi:MAG: hypothetical protein M3R24_22140 [Chloroflexota bacterium]|nr:hypothetical protein [Chloroflexota bacterium]PLS79036.1 MAG: hypothetical protein CYG59_15320 [Chloroflexota bacterium]
MTIPYQLLILIPFLIMGVFGGLRRGWIEEAITTIGLIFALVFFSNVERTSLLGVLINRVVQAFALFFGALLGTTFEAQGLVEIGNPNVFQFVGFVLTVILAYIVGSAVGRRRGLTRLGYAMGGILGAINVFLVASQLITFITQYFPNFFERTVTVTSEGGNVLREYLPSIFALLFILLLVIFFLRLPKIRS